MEAQFSYFTIQPFNKWESTRNDSYCRHTPRGFWRNQGFPHRYHHFTHNNSHGNNLLSCQLFSVYNAIIRRPTFNMRRAVTSTYHLLEDIPLDDDHPNWITCIDTQVNSLVRQELILFLKGNLDVFAWSHEDMPKIDRNTMVHQLNVFPSFSPV